MRKTLFFYVFFLLMLLPTHQVFSQDEKNEIKNYQLESIEVLGTSRLTAQQIAEELNLNVGTLLDDEFVLQTKAKLLSLGLFKDVILSMKKGSEKGRVKLVVDIVEDDDVLTDWALGGTLGVIQSETQFASGDFESAPLGYHLNLVSRNLFNELHRASMTVDVNSEGHLDLAILHYGLPRFTEEGVQFDVEAGVIDTNKRYIDTLGFGAWMHGLWTSSYGKYGHLQYGVSMLANTSDQYKMPGFPKSVAGPRLGYYRETRLKSFVPSEGYLLGAAMIVAPVQAEHSLLELNLAKTFDIFSFSSFTLDAQSRHIGRLGYTARAGARFDLPFNFDSGEKSLGSSFIHLRTGVDQMPDTQLFGSSATLGLRFHSSGFIAEFAFKITKLPKTFEKIKDET